MSLGTVAHIRSFVGVIEKGRHCSFSVSDMVNIKLDNVVEGNNMRYGTQSVAGRRTNA